MNNLDRNDYKIAPLLEEEDPVALKSEDKSITRTLYLTTIITVIIAASIFFSE